MEVQFTLAEALWRLGQDRPRALELAKRAHDLAARLGHKPYLQMADRWLSEHR